MNIDPEKLQITLNILKDIVTIISTVIVACVAWLGLQTWKKQLKGKTHYELARRLSRATLKVRDTINNLRNPAIFAFEESAALTKAGIAIDRHNHNYKNEKQKAVYDIRWGHVADAISELEIELLEAEALWGEKVTEKTKPLFDNIRTLYHSLSIYLGELDEPVLTENYEYGLRIHGVIFDALFPPNTDNQFTSELKDSIKKIQDFLKPYLAIDE